MIQLDTFKNWTDEQVLHRYKSLVIQSERMRTDQRELARVIREIRRRRLVVR